MLQWQIHKEDCSGTEKNHLFLDRSLCLLVRYDYITLVCGT